MIDIKNVELANIHGGNAYDIYGPNANSKCIGKYILIQR